MCHDIPAIQGETAQELAAVKADMIDAQKRVEESYVQIGKLYVAMHASDYDTAFETFFEQILQAEETVRQCRSKARELLGVVCCEGCGNDVSKEAAFCSKCGTAMPDRQAEDVSDKAKCAVCGRFVHKDETFCTFCHMPMMPISEKAIEKPEPVEDISETENAPVAAAEEVPLQTEERDCPRCGKPVKAGLAFCTQCGQCMTDGDPVPPSAMFTPKKFCMTCGRVLTENARFCIGCGARVE